METTDLQDLRIDRLDKLIVLTIENQTAILGLLRSIDARLNEHSAILSDHSAILNDHSSRLSNLENLAARIIEELAAIKDMLDSPRGMGFTPEPGDATD